MRKRVLALSLLAAMAFSTTAQAKTVEFVLDKTDMRVSENFETTDSTLLAAPFILNDRTMVPARALSEQYGAQVGWNAETRTVSVKTENADIQLVIDDTTAFVNGEAVALDAPPVIRGDITFIPVRFVTESMGFHVTFIPRTRSILITDQKPILVNGAPVYDYEIDGVYYMFALQQGAELASSIAYSTALQNAILAQEANKAGVALTDANDAVINQLLEADPYPALLDGELALIFEKDLLSAQYIDAVTNEHKDDAEVGTYYKENYLCAKHILIAGTDETAKKKANEVYKKARTSKDFDSLIAEYGEDPGMSAYPDGYVFTSGEMVLPFEEGTKALKPGSISQPIPSEYGYHIIKREPLPEMTDTIAGHIVSLLHLKPIVENAVIEQ